MHRVKLEDLEFALISLLRRLPPQDVAVFDIFGMAGKDEELFRPNAQAREREEHNLMLVGPTDAAPLVHITGCASYVVPPDLGESGLELNSHLSTSILSHSFDI